jgi:hypothetical protein
MHVLISFFGFPMHRKTWNILCWNVRGLNATEKQDAVRLKIDECGYSIVCLQETKIQFFDSSIIRKFAPRCLGKFDYVPSIGSSGGILVSWNSANFVGLTIDKLQFGLTMAFTSNLSAKTWKLTTVYGPCVEPERSEFVAWLKSHSIEDDENLFFLRDFKFYRSLEDRNQPGGNLQDTLIFNNIIGHLLTVNSCIKFRLDLQADKSPVVVKGPFFPLVVNPRYRICGTNV